MIATSTAIITPAMAQDFIGKQQPVLQSDRMTPEALWAMGRIGGFKVSPNGKQAVYAVTYYSVKQNKSHSVLYTLDLNTSLHNSRQAPIAKWEPPTLMVEKRLFTSLPNRAAVNFGR